MHYNVNTQPIYSKHVIADVCNEIPVDIDFSLPDYCPDIQKILKCIITPSISFRDVSGDRLNIEGSTLIRVVYFDSNNSGLKVCENFSPFSLQIDLHSSPENPVVATRIKPGYVNCRAVSPRKVDIHGAFSLCSTVAEKGISQLTSEIIGDDVNQKTETVNFSNLIAFSEQQFVVSDVLEIDESKPPVELILNTTQNLIINSCKPSDNMVSLEGEIILKVLYLSDVETSQTEVLEYSIPVSQTLDVLGVTQESDVIVTGEILNSSVKFFSSEETTQEESEFKCSVIVEAYENNEINVVKDAYSTNYNMELSKENVKFSNFLVPIDENFSTKNSIESSEQKISEIVDVWISGCNYKTNFDNDKIVVSGKANACVLAVDFEKTPFYFERMMDFSYEKSISNLESANCRVECKVIPVSMGYRITNDTSLELKSDYKVNASIFEDTSHNLVVGANADETLPIQKDSAAGMIIYYAENGENIWDIAAKYHTEPQNIIDENGLTSEIIEQNSAILIPILS